MVWYSLVTQQTHTHFHIDYFWSYFEYSINNTIVNCNCYIVDIYSVVQVICKLFMVIIFSFYILIPISTIF